MYLVQRKPWQSRQEAPPIPRQPMGVPPMVNTVSPQAVGDYFGTPSEQGRAPNPGPQSWSPSFKPPGAASFQKSPMPMQQQAGAGPSMSRGGMLTQGGIAPQGNPNEFMQLAQEYLRKNRGM